MLGEQGILAPADTERLHEGLAAIAAEAEAGEFRFLEGDEDVHSAVERRLVDIVGDVGGMLHTGRSRNDQVALDLRLYLVDAVAARTTGHSSPGGVLWPTRRSSTPRPWSPPTRTSNRRRRCRSATICSPMPGC